MNRISKSTKITILCIIMLTVVSSLLVIMLWRLDKANINIPISYTGWDDFAAINTAKTIQGSGWIFNNKYLGAPYDVDYRGLVAAGTYNFDNILLKLLLSLTHNIFAAVNLQFISFFIMISIISYLVMRSLKISNNIAFFTSLTYAFLPYIFLRGMNHTVLSAYQFVPLSILLCIWIFFDDNFFIFNKDFLKYKRNIFAICFTVLIANNGIAYYAFFTCFFVLITALIKSLEIKDLKILIRGISLVSSLVFFFMLALLPAILYKLGDGRSIQLTSRAKTEAEIYGLKITQLFIPTNSHGIKYLDNLINYYNSNAPLVNENRVSYLGIAGIIGFLILIIFIFIKRSDNELFVKIKFFSELNISAILLATIGGFGSVFAIIISSMIRAYNRISIFIAYFALLALAYILDDIGRKFKKKILYQLMISTFFVVCIFEQFPGNVPNYAYTEELYNNDFNFVKKIEESCGNKNAMIFELPYHRYPEGGAVNNMSDYQLMAPSFLSNKIKWSYGGLSGSKSDIWNQKISSLNTLDMIKSLSIAGFDGIYIDKRAYTEEEYLNLENEIKNITNSSPIYSENELLSYISLNEFNVNYKKLYTDKEWEKVNNLILNMPIAINGNGFYGVESDQISQWIWISNNAEMHYFNMGNKSKKITIDFTIGSSSQNDSNLTISLNEIKKTFKVNSNAIRIVEKIILKPGENVLKFETDAPKVEAPNDPRNLYLRITNFNFYNTNNFK